MSAPPLHLPFRHWAEYTSRDFAQLDRSRIIAILPVAAIEQHGPHLPLAVDTAIIEALVAAVVDRIPAEVPALFLPTQAIGKSNEHARYPGTLTLSAETLARNWMEIGASVAASGVRKLVLFNSHGGQSSVMDIVARDLRERHGMFAICANWYASDLPPGLIDDEEMRFGIHAGDLETSMLLALHPELVNMSAARDFESREQALLRSYTQLGYDSGAGRIAWQTHDLNPMGACGNASRATAEKGRQIIEHVTGRFIDMLREIDRLPVEWLDGRPAW